MEGTFEKVCLLANEAFDILHKELNEETTIGDLGGDSLDVLNFQMALEDEFDIEITEDDFLKEFGDEATLGNITALVNKKMGQAQ